MEKPLINILIRTNDRPNGFRSCMESIKKQTYTNYHIIIYDNSSITSYIKWGTYQVIQDNTPCKGYEYNLFCNTLKEKVNEGYYFFLDDDDTLHDENSLAEISEELTDPNQAVICQFLRANKPKPSNEFMDNKLIVNGRIGMPCIILHHSQKNIAHFTDKVNADYLYIKEVSQKIPCKFVKKILVNSPKRNFGK